MQTEILLSFNRAAIHDMECSLPVCICVQGKHVGKMRKANL